MKPDTVKYLLEYYVKERGGVDVPDSLFKKNVTMQVQSATAPIAREVAESSVVLNSSEREKCKEIAKKLIEMAEEYESLRHSVSPKSKSALSQRSTLDLNDKEKEVLNKIQSAGSFPSVADVAEHLSDHLTGQTFKGALFHLCAHATSYPQEISLAFELYNATLPRSRRDSITRALIEYLEEKPDLENL